MSAAVPHLIPLWIKIPYTAFMAVLIPVYLKHYGPTNFLYFCDVAAIMTLIAVWMESPLLLSAALVGIFIPQLIWVVDFCFEVTGHPLTGMTNYMFQPPFFLRFLSFFHFWLPFLLIYLVRCVGFDKRGVVLWTILMWGLLTVCYNWMPPPSPVNDPKTGEQLRSRDQPVNINYVYNIQSDEKEQEWIDDRDLYLAAYMAILVGIYGVTHLVFWALMPTPRNRCAHPGA